MIDAKTRGWVVVETANLQVQSNAKEKRVLELAVHYQRLYDAIAEHELPCGFDRMTSPLQVTLFAQSDQPSFYRGGQSRVLGLHGQVVVRSADERESTRIFVHELTHRLVALCFPDAATWLHEGMAGFYETARLHGDTLELGFPPYVFIQPSKWGGQLYADVEGHRVTVLPSSSAPGVKELRDMPRAEFYSTKTGRKTANYAGSWTLVHLLKMGDMNLSREFIQYLAALHEGKAEADAWAASFETSVIEKRYREYLDQQYFSRVRSVDVVERESLAARPLSQTSAALRLAELESWHDERGVKRATAYIDFAEERPASQVDALLMRGAVHVARGDDASANQSFADALERSPDNPDALAALLAFRLSTEGSIARDTGPTLEAAAENLIAHATSSHHYAVAASWTTYRENDPHKGLLLATRAIDLDGTNQGAYVVAGDAAYQLGDAARALGAYQAALALSRHFTDETREKLERRVAALRNTLDRHDRQ